MSNGAFLKENKKTDRGSAIPKLTDEERRARTVKRKRRRRRNRIITAIAMIGILATLVGAGILFLCKNKSIVGKWSMDAVTSYRFDKNGQGAMILPSWEYPFQYTTKDGILYIDFENENAKDSEFEYEITDDVLTLNGGNSTVKGIYVLARTEE